jgi:hypothetical protein
MMSNHNFLNRQCIVQLRSASFEVVSIINFDILNISVEALTAIDCHCLAQREDY